MQQSEHQEQPDRDAGRGLVSRYGLTDYLTNIRTAFSSKIKSASFNPGYLLEIGILAVWTLWLLGAYVDFNPQIFPGGREFGSSVQTHHLWENVRACGYCAFWNGSERGGVPAFADIHGSMLHPVVAAATLLFGVINGSKITLIIFFWLAGVAQWWLAKLFNLSWLPRMWSAMLAIAGGHLAGRMELGAINVLIATSAGSLVFPAVLAVHKKPGFKNAALLGIIGAGAILGGSGYMQVGLISAIPAILLLLIGRDLKLSRTWKMYALAVGLALLLCAVFLVPFLHFSPNFSKAGDPEFNTAQTVSYALLNLLINDPAYYATDALDKLPYPHLYTLFIGWPAVILAVAGTARTEMRDRRWVLFLISAAGLIFLTSSAVTLEWLVNYFPGVAGVRHPPQIASLAITPILALAAYGLEKVLNLDWPAFRLEFNRQPGTSALSTTWIVLIPLALNLLDAKTFSQTWIFTERQTPQVLALLEGLRTPGMEWVNPPFGEHFYVEAAVSMGLKLSPGIMSWGWEGREIPVASREANRVGPPPGPVKQINLIDGIPVYERTDQPYAAIYDSTGNILSTCKATGRGGFIDVRCDRTEQGRLIVKENAWSGWHAWDNEGEKVDLIAGPWLELDALPGLHIYRFRYIPWDAPAGILLSLIGISISVWLWRKKE